MKLLLTLIDWQYPADGQAPPAEVWDLNDPDSIDSLNRAFMHGFIVELRAEGDSAEAIDKLRSVSQEGGASQISLSDDQSGKL